MLCIITERYVSLKKILITGKNSYIGTSLEKWLEVDSESFQIDTIDLREPSWKEKNFSKYDVVFHVAGIAHVSRNPKMEQLYYRVNRDLAIEVATKSKLEGIKQFIFMSSIIIYGNCSNSNGEINYTTEPSPENFYGKSKLEAENGLLNLSSSDFKVAILRPPMIYGKGSKGNYQKLSKLAQKICVFPDFENKRSMLHIDNLCEFIKSIIVNERKGIYFPQNDEYVKTSELVKVISEVYDRKIILVKFLNPILNFFRIFPIINKLFGNLYYDKSMSINDGQIYQIRKFKESIILTESREIHDK